MKYDQIKQITRKLRHNATPPEQKLWRYLRRKQLDGRKFLRQHAIIFESIGDEHFFYVPDFYCFKENLAIELDGKIHLYTKERDENRDEILNDLGIKVLRFQNQELDEIETVLEKIKREFKNE
jgi:very-short-patch-repair endonuclease